MTTERVDGEGVNTLFHGVSYRTAGAAATMPAVSESRFATLLQELLRHSLNRPFQGGVLGGIDIEERNPWGLLNAFGTLLSAPFITGPLEQPLARNLFALLNQEFRTTPFPPTLLALLGADPRRIPWPSQVDNDSTAWLQGVRLTERRTSPLASVQQFQNADARPLSLREFPRPAGDNGRGMHWIPTVYQTPDVVDRFVRELQDMKIKWAVILNDGTDTERNDYLVQRLVQAGIMPVMRVYTAGLNPIPPDELEELVRYYRARGVYYYQLYNEPNLRFENGGREPDVGRYLDLWVPAARAVIRAGGFPGFGALSPSGDVDDLEFLRAALRELKRRRQVDVLDRAWLSIHNYIGHYPVEDTGDGQGFFRYRRYADILWQELGRYMPMIGTEGGAYTANGLSIEEQVERVRKAYAYMARREPYFLAYSYWIIANEAGGGRDPAFSHQALFRPDGVSPVVSALKEL